MSADCILDSLSLLFGLELDTHHILEADHVAPDCLPGLDLEPGGLRSGCLCRGCCTRVLDGLGLIELSFREKLYRFDHTIGFSGVGDGC